MLDLLVKAAGLGFIRWPAVPPRAFFAVAHLAVLFVDYLTFGNRLLTHLEDRFLACVCDSSLPIWPHYLQQVSITQHNLVW